MRVFFKTIYSKFFKLLKQSIPEHPYRLLCIERDENENFIAIIQIQNKKEIFRMSPEEILSNNNITDSFSQRDIRTLTYLGYLGINSPKYKILAKRLCENDSMLIFAIQERGKKKPILKTASEICLDENIIVGLNQKDAHTIGYAMGSEQVVREKQQKEDILKFLESKKGELL